MARFYADIQGNRGGASRMGTADSGITAHARGWDVGARVSLHVNVKGEDEVTVYATGGSNGALPEVHLASFTLSDLKRR